MLSVTELLFTRVCYSIYHNYIMYVINHGHTEGLPPVFWSHILYFFCTSDPQTSHRLITGWAATGNKTIQPEIFSSITKFDNTWYRTYVWSIASETLNFMSTHSMSMSWIIKKWFKISSNVSCFIDYMTLAHIHDVLINSCSTISIIVPWT